MREATIKIGDKEVNVRTSGYTPILYAELFNSNIFEEMQIILDSAAKNGVVPFEKIPVLYRLAYCMAKEADESLPPMNEWLKQFDVYDIPTATEKLIGLWAADGKQQSKPKGETA